MSKIPSDTRESIVNAALQLFMRHGYDGTGLSQIVGASGVSKGAFYHYFASKAQLHREVVEQFFLTPFEQFDLQQLAELSPRKARKALRSFYAQLPDSISRFTQQDMNRYFALMFDSISRLPDFQARIASFYADLLKALTHSFAARGSGGKKAKRAAKRRARKFLARLEGEIFLGAVLDELQSDKSN